MASSPSQHTGTIARAAGAMSVAVFASRILGLVREQVLAGLFGAGYAIDAFVVAYRIPNLLRDLLAEGALSSAFVTVFAQTEQRHGLARTWRLANNVIVCLTLVVGGIVLLGMLSSSGLVALMAPDFGRIPGKHQLTVLMTTIMFPFLLLVSLAALGMGILNNRGKFFIPALASSFYNLGSIVVGVSLSLVLPWWGVPAIVGMACGTVVGGLLQLVVQVPLLYKVGYRPALVFELGDEGLRHIVKLMLPAVVGLSASQINIFINTFYASSCAEGSVSWLNYAYRLVHLPQGLFGVALSVASLPLLSKLAAQDDLPGLKQACVSSLTLGMVVTLPAACGLIVLAKPICAVIFQHGRFTAWDTEQTAAALAYYSLGLLAFSGVKILVPVFYALNNTRLPVVGSFLTVAANLVCINITLEAFQHRAIALSTSVSMAINFLFLAVMLYRKVGGYQLGYLGVNLGKTVIASLVMSAAVWWMHQALSSWLGSAMVSEVITLAGAILTGIATYFLLLYVFRVPEVTALWRQVRRGGR